MTSIFTAEFLKWLEGIEEGNTAAAEEADLAGPFEIVTEGNLHSVALAGGRTVFHHGTRDMAWLVAAGLPAISRPRQVVYLDTKQDDGFAVVDLKGRVLGYTEHYHQELGQTLHTLDSLCRDPMALARLLYVASGAALPRAGEILREQGAREK